MSDWTLRNQHFWTGLESVKSTLFHLHKTIVFSGLFSQAEEVLIRIGRAELIPSLRDVAEKVGKSAESFKAEEEMFSDAPDHFLDPIMSHIMRDPVKLPTSGQVNPRDVQGSIKFLVFGF